MVIPNLNYLASNMTFEESRKCRHLEAVSGIYRPAKQNIGQPRCSHLRDPSNESDAVRGAACSAMTGLSGRGVPPTLLFNQVDGSLTSLSDAISRQRISVT